MKQYSHLRGLDLGDLAQDTGPIAPEILIGADHYWELVTGRIVRGESGPIALETHLGWVLTGPASSVTQSSTTSLMTVASTARSKVRETDSLLRAFWELESLGIVDRESSLYDQFKTNIVFKEGRYEVPLPWRNSPISLSLNYHLSLKRVYNLLKRLQRDPHLLKEYDSIIQEQMRNGIVEIVETPDLPTEGRTHYLPHHAVVRQDKLTTKVRVVYDASAKSEGSSLNECLHVGPKFDQKILEILLRFRVYRTALVADIEKAFLMISIVPKDRDVLRFIWFSKVLEESRKIQVLRFKRVVFGVASSPFLLNATIRHHIEANENLFPQIAPTLLRSMYVDDLVCGAQSIEEAYKLFNDAKELLISGGFNLRKFVSNSPELQNHINKKENVVDITTNDYKVLGVQWNVPQDTLIFDISEVINKVDLFNPTKRTVVGAVSSFYDPIGVLSPVVVVFKIFLQELAKAKLDWDTPLNDRFLERWKKLVKSLEECPPIVVPRFCLSDGNSSDVTSYYLSGFCDASNSAYAAVIYVITIQGGRRQSRFVASKTRVAPTNTPTIPRLELIGALLLSRLIATVTRSLSEVISLQDPVCYTDSKITLYWIYGLDRDWKPFIQNRVEEIRKLVPPSRWKHCAGADNPSDIPSRGISMMELQGNDIWFQGPDWLTNSDTEPYQITEMPEECALELRANERRQTLGLLTTHNENSGIASIILIQNYSSLNLLLRVTVYVLKFVQLIKMKEIVMNELRAQAEILWIKECQMMFKENPKFDIWKKQLGLFIDENDLLRCRGRLTNASLPYSAKHPIILGKGHPYSILIVKQAHERVLHNGVKETLTEIRSKYWIPQGRSFVRKILYNCTLCKRFGAVHYSAPPPPPLPPFRIQEEPPFTFTGVDFAGPLYVTSSNSCKGEEDKVWICLFTCCIVRAVHIEIVTDLSVSSFLRCLKRFVARRGLPRKLISDNGKTFKGAAKILRIIMGHPEVHEYLSNVGVDWLFNVERAPWWGGMFERMIGSAKKCLRKTVGRSKLAYDELNTAVIEIEMILNSRPLTYLTTDDIEEPLTPSHLIVGRRLRNLPDNLCYKREDENYSPQVTPEVLTRRMRHLSYTLDRFWKRWASEYLTGLRESHSYITTRSKGTESIEVGDTVVIYDEKKPRGFWLLGRVEEVFPGRDKQVRSAAVRVYTGGARSKILRRPVQHLYPIELSSRKEPSSEPVSEPLLETTPTESSVEREVSRRRSTRGAALEARDQILARSLVYKEL